MSGHIDLEIADLVAERLSGSRKREVEEHLKECDACAADLAWARELRDQALRQGLRHLSPARVVELSNDRAAAAEVEREHLEHCPQCRDELEWAASVPEDVVRASTTSRSFRWIWLAAAAAVVLGLVLFPRKPDIDYAGLARLEPLPVRITRAVPEPGSFEESRLLALESYAAGDYATARVHLETALDRDPENAEVLLYLGSAELLQGQLDAAAIHLALARDRSGDSRLRNEASWQLANLALARGRPAEALRILAELDEAGGHRAEDARNLIESLH